MTEQFDPAQLKEKLSQWREQTDAASPPLSLLLAESLLARAEGEREAVAHRLYRKADKCLQQALPSTPRPTQRATEEQRPSPLRQLVNTLRSDRPEPQVTPLSKLDRQLQEQNRKLFGEPEAAVSQIQETVNEPKGLRAASKFQQFKLINAKHRKVRIALEQKPENPGPLNPHMLAVKILNEIQAISPAYLDRLVSYMDVLNTLQHNRDVKKRKAGRNNKANPRK
jgi:hypothetical protein